MAQYKRTTPKNLFSTPTPSRHPFALAFSPKRMAEADCNVRRAPTEPEEEAYYRITPKGRAKLAAANHASRIIVEKKELILAKLREADGPDEPVMLQNVCHRAGVTVEEAMLLIFEINNFCIRLQDAPEDRPFISLFFNGHSGEVWAELFDCGKGGAR